MNIEDVTKKQVEEWSDEETLMWAEQFSRQEQVRQIKKKLFDMIEIREVKSVDN